MNSKYSIIIPVYNAEETLRRCIDSLLNTKYENMELILINDGSKDSSGDLCEEYAEKDLRVHYIEKENGGVSSARNAGLDMAKGEYVLFVDSDDYVVSNYCSILDEALQQTPCDWIQFSSCVDNGRERQEKVYQPLKTQNRNNLMPVILNAICRKTLNSPWAKLYRRDIIEKNHIRFPVGASVAEDRAFNIKYSMYIHSYCASDRILYCVNTENENSLTRGCHYDLNKQFEITGKYFSNALAEAPIPEEEKDQYQKAYNFGECRSIYHDAKLLHKDHFGWISRQKRLWELCSEINQKRMIYPKTRYCTLITLPVRLHLTPLIDVIAWKMIH